MFKGVPGMSGEPGIKGAVGRPVRYFHLVAEFKHLVQSMRAEIIWYRFFCASAIWFVAAFDDNLFCGLLLML